MKNTFKNNDLIFKLEQAFKVKYLSNMFAKKNIKQSKIFKIT